MVSKVDGYFQKAVLVMNMMNLFDIIEFMAMPRGADLRIADDTFITGLNELVDDIHIYGAKAFG